jgi:hypothetical protein
MKAIVRRIGRLEKRLFAQPERQPDRKGPSAADILRDRRRRRLEAAGKRFEEPAPARTRDETGRLLSVADILRDGRKRAYERNRAQGSSPKGCL